MTKTIVIPMIPIIIPTIISMRIATTLIPIPTEDLVLTKFPILMENHITANSKPIPLPI